MNRHDQYLTQVNQLVEQDSTVDRGALRSIALSKALSLLDDDQMDAVLDTINRHQMQLWDERDKLNQRNRANAR